MRRLLLILGLCPCIAFAAKPITCVDTTEATRHLSQEICISAHVYDVVKLEDGTRFLDTCPHETPDAECHFTILSLPQDWNEVGELEKYRDADVHVRGIVTSLHGRAGIMLSHARQFYGSPPKFRPNPLLLRGFTGDDGKPAIHDPNLRSSGGHRAFMNSNDRETLPAK